MPFKQQSGSRRWYKKEGRRKYEGILEDGKGCLRVCEIKKKAESAAMAVNLVSIFEL